MESKLTYDQACDINRKRREQEPEIFSSLLKNLTKIDLKRIDISGNRFNHNHSDVDSHKYYLFAENGFWYLGHANKVWFGWTLDCGSHTIQLRDADFLWEIDLPEAPKEPLGRVKYPREENEE
jgi:hypothetical protein